MQLVDRFNRHLRGVIYVSVDDAFFPGDRPVAKKQTRKSISISKVVYEELKIHSEQTGMSMSSLTEQAVRAIIRADVAAE